MNLHERVEQLEQQVRELTNTKRPAHHGDKWTHDDDERIFWGLETIITEEAKNLHRTRPAIRMRIMHVLKREYPDEWIISQRA
jgi:hypothetical protein